ncbi:MAG TPA: hypothetical protein VHM72_08885 [Solirubrobacteraceae bacterium]|nr:hypothetical protein [Solirubrobacteraceae bacterium]
MAEVVVIEFAQPNAVEIYNSVNKELGWDGVPDAAAWPAGMLSHVSGEQGDKLIVVEVWESQAAQGEFMSSRLGPAFAAVDAPQPSRIEWFNSVNDIHSHSH